MKKVINISAAIRQRGRNKLTALTNLRLIENYVIGFNVGKSET